MFSATQCIWNTEMTSALDCRTWNENISREHDDWLITADRDDVAMSWCCWLAAVTDDFAQVRHWISPLTHQSPPAHPPQPASPEPGELPVLCNAHYVAATRARLLTNHDLLLTWPKLSACGSVAEWLGCSTCDQQVAGLNPGLPIVEHNPGQVVYAHVSLSPSSIIWYQPMGGDALWLGR